MTRDNKKKPSIMDGSKLAEPVQAPNITGNASAQKPSLVRTITAPTKINPLTFPLLNDADKPFGTIENIEHMLKFYAVTVAYDVIIKDVIISIPSLKSSSDNYRNVAEAELANLAVLNCIYSANFERFVTAIASRNQVNPVMQWVESKPWDNKDRIGELCATITVTDEFLVDPTGNTRWFCLPCIDINHNHTIDMQQMWAQVYEQMFKGKDSPQWWLTDDEQDQLEALNSRHTKRNVVQDLLESELLFDAPKESWTRLAAAALLKVVGIQNPTNHQAKECANFLRQRIGQPTRSQGSVRWLVPPISEALQPPTKTYQPKETPIHDEDDHDKY